VRVVSGKYKGKRFNPPSKFPSRPTTDFAKEALFNILENEYELEHLNILDLFAGTGNISLEFLSREAGTVTSVDENPNCIRFLAKMKKELNDSNWFIIKSDAFKFLIETNQKFDILFADPPFDMPDQKRLPEIVFNRNLLTENGLLIVEHGRENNFENITHFREMRNYGGVCFSFFEH